MRFDSTPSVPNQPEASVNLYFGHVNITRGEACSFHRPSFIDRLAAATASGCDAT
jgi:hypothetical protein